MCLLVCSLVVVSMVGLVAAHSALQRTTHHTSWLERSRQLFQRTACLANLHVQAVAVGGAVEKV